ncbi:hypothetical protein AVEN_19389-1 [Araneus ventricosus]|uniref:OTU domain-containing protein n=1 Tax=Araneus ventricosus TaxID=182803 RepID=A0A4Y2KEP1_ARAVE|nr:hypothetical protein AVEN_19389-1 [Araneus ventricosus]
MWCGIKCLYETRPRRNLHIDDVYRKSLQHSSSVPCSTTRTMSSDLKKTSSASVSKFVHHSGARFKIFPITGDGNCLFRAMAYFVLCSQDEHNFIRNRIVKYVCKHWDRFQNFLPQDDKESYRTKMSSPRTFGSEAEIVAFTEIFDCSLKVYFMSHPERDPLVFGDSSTECFVLYSGPLDCGHYDVLFPTSEKPCNLSRHRQAIRDLRRRTLEEFGDDLENFKENYLEDSSIVK